MPPRRAFDLIRLLQWLRRRERSAIGVCGGVLLASRAQTAAKALQGDDAVVTRFVCCARIHARQQAAKDLLGLRRAPQRPQRLALARLHQELHLRQRPCTGY